jgi:hypothetical protein
LNKTIASVPNAFPAEVLAALALGGVFGSVKEIIPKGKKPLRQCKKYLLLLPP